MVKVAMLHLDGTTGDDLRLAAAASMTELFQSHVVGLFLNALPHMIPGAESVNVALWDQLQQQARQTGDQTESAIRQRLAEFGRSTELRRFDAFAEAMGGIAAREARSADAFIALPLGDDQAQGEADIVEEVLFGSGRHLFLVGRNEPFNEGFHHALVAWNGSREATRALAEGLPYLHISRLVTVVVVDRGPAALDPEPGADAVAYLKHHGIVATLHQVERHGRDVASVLIDEAGERKADLLVMGGYGHSRLREWLLGGVTHRLLRQTPTSLVIAH
jgi:nucleotide-binding universal stress UspA family protein